MSASADYELVECNDVSAVPHFALSRARQDNDRFRSFSANPSWAMNPAATYKATTRDRVVIDEGNCRDG